MSFPVARLGLGQRMLDAIWQFRPEGLLLFHNRDPAGFGALDDRDRDQRHHSRENSEHHWPLCSRHQSMDNQPTAG